MISRSSAANILTHKTIARLTLLICLIIISYSPILPQDQILNQDYEEVSPRFLKRENQLISQIDSLEAIGIKGPQIWDIKLSLINQQLIYTKKYVSGKTLIHSLLDEIDSTQYPIIYGDALTVLGRSYKVNGDLNKSAETHFKAINFKEKTDNPRIAVNYEEIAFTLNSKNNFTEALRYYLKAEELNKSSGKTRPKLTQRIGRTYNRIGDFENALKYYNESIIEAKRKKNKLIQGTSLSHLGALYHDLKDYEKSISKTLESIQIRGNLMGLSHRIGAAHILAKNYLKLDQLDLARKYALEAYEISILQGAKMTRADNGWNQAVLRTMVEIEIKIKDDPALLEQHNNLIKAIDSFYSISNTTNYNELYTKLDLGEKEKEILKQEIHIEKEKRSKNRLLFLATLLGLLLLSFAYYLRKKMHYEKKITKQNEIITKSLSEKEVLLKEIHHRVKNNLQVVSSLLSIQSRSLKDPKAIDIIEEGKSRVNSMSLIHQNLYTKNSLSSVEMKGYIKKLANNLIKTYNISTDEISYIDEVEEIYLDVDTVMPLGLIINELISNTLKHAFPNDSYGEITISLKEESNQLILQISDNGVGFEAIDILQKDGSFGHSIIRAFKKKLDASIEIESNNGTKVTMTINKYKKMR